MASSLSAACKPIRTGPRRRSKSGGFQRVAVHTNANVSTEALEAARQRIQYVFTQLPKPKDMLTAARVLRNLEQILGMPRSEWNAGLVRSLWPALESCIRQRKQSPDHEEAWLILAGAPLMVEPAVSVGNRRSASAADDDQHQHRGPRQPAGSTLRAARAISRHQLASDRHALLRIQLDPRLWCRHVSSRNTCATTGVN